MLTLTNIHAGYGKKEVLHGVTLEVAKGEIIAIIGPNGAGKSTLLKVAAGLLKPHEGQVSFEGEDITQLDCPARVKKGIVYFIQGGEVFPNLSVRENLELGWLGKNGKMTSMIDNILDLFPDMESWLAKRAGLLSGGQRQQVALAMVLLKQPKLLLLDEPSAGLAPNLVKETLKRVREINRRFQTTLVLVEQNVKEGLNIAHRCGIMAAGEMVSFEEKPQVLLTNNKLEKVFLGFAK